MPTTNKTNLMSPHSDRYEYCKSDSPKTIYILTSKECKVAINSQILTVSTEKKSLS